MTLGWMLIATGTAIVLAVGYVRLVVGDMTPYDEDER